MKKVFLMAIAALMMVACGERNSNGMTSEQMVKAIDSLQQLNDQKDQELNDLFSTMNDIEEGFRQIDEAQGRVTVARQGESTNSAQRIRENMQFIQKTMAENAELIEKLKQRLNSLSIKSDQLTKVVENLTTQLEEKNAELLLLHEQLSAKDVHIAELDEQVTVLNEDVSNLRDEKRQHEETINTQDRQLNTAWYAFGTKKELKQNNILKSGEVLQEQDFNKSYFTEIDIRKTKDFKLESRDAKILTTHPKGSYVLERDANKQYVLHIVNPDQFWGTSRYLVVQVK